MYKRQSLNRLRFSDDFEQSLSKILHLMQTASARRESDGYCRALGEAVCALLREWDRRAPENALVERIQVELSRHFSDPEFSAGRALEKMDYCPDYLRRLFRQNTGETPTEEMCIRDSLRIQSLSPGTRAAAGRDPKVRL